MIRRSLPWRLGIQKAGSLPSGDPIKKGGSARAWRQNENPRYHCLPLSKTGKELPDVVADFKHYFSVGADYLTHLKSQALVASLNDLYREDLTQRFTAYLARIGLPNPIRAF